MATDEIGGEEDVLDGMFTREAPADPEHQPQEQDGVARDDKGRFAPKTPAEPEAQAPVETVPSEPVQTQPETTSRNVPLSELMAERKKRQEFEQRLMEAEARAKAFEQVSQRQPQYQQPPQFQQYQQPEPPPDFYTDPEAAFNARLMPVQQQVVNMMLHQSEIMARDKYGDEIVDKALQAANAAGDRAKAEFLQSPHPWGEMVKWHKRQQTLQVVGEDPEAYRAKVETELRAKILAELKAGSQAPAPKFPGSLATATAQGSQGAMLTEEAAMDSIFSSSRDRRKG